MKIYNTESKTMLHFFFFFFIPLNCSATGSGDQEFVFLDQMISLRSWKREFVSTCLWVVLHLVPIILYSFYHAVATSFNFVSTRVSLCFFCTNTMFCFFFFFFFIVTFNHWPCGSGNRFSFREEQHHVADAATSLLLLFHVFCIAS